MQLGPSHMARKWQNYDSESGTYFNYCYEIKEIRDIEKVRLLLKITQKQRLET